MANPFETDGVWLRCALHAHTTESDGKDSLEDMVAAARRRGLSYLAVTDHSRAVPSHTRGRGMDEPRCLEHLARIRAFCAQKHVPLHTISIDLPLEDAVLGVLRRGGLLA